MYKIMLADDEGIVIDSLKFIIEKEFKDICEVQYAKTGRSVIELAESFRPDIAVMDIQMPGINGIDAMKEKETVWVPTLVTTGNLLGCGRYPQEELEKIFDSARANVSCAWEKGVLLAAGSDAGAYRVLHGQGLLDEYQIFCDLFGETEELKNRLKEGESVIRRKFQAEKVWKLTSKSTIIDAASAS